MTDNKWHDLIDHAKSCVQSGKHYHYCYDEERSVTVVFDITGQLKGYTVMGCFHPPDPLVHNLKVGDKTVSLHFDWCRLTVLFYLSDVISSKLTTKFSTSN